MNDNQTPDWLIKTQHKSWEPEILISGITLTFLFIISNYIYNFFGMLVQDFGVYEIIAIISYLISIMILTGLKIILIVHLILRGIWTGLVGLSYVFPDGVKTQNLSENNKNIKPIKPEIFVIKLENLCSLLFSFIFYMITSIIGIFILSVPFIMLFVIGLDLYYIYVLSTYFLIPITVILAFLSVVFSRKIKNSKLKSKLDNSFFNHTQLIYFSNIGKRKTNFIFAVYFLIVVLMSYSDLAKFEFENNKGIEISASSSLVTVNQNLYENLRDRKLRIPKATIGRFRIDKKNTELFVSFFKEDMYTIDKLKNDPTLLKKHKIESSGAALNLTNLYTITIDDKEISQLKWYRTENIPTSQKGIMTTISLDSLKKGHHEIKINKIYWSIRKKEMKLIENWEFIPFETMPLNNTKRYDHFFSVEDDSGRII